MNQKSEAVGQDKPLVSVMIPTYNRADFLLAAITSVLAQTYPNVEIIVVDDGSTDGTPELMQRFKDRVIYRRKANGGVASARNAAFALAKGELLALMDSDDICEPQRIALQVACLMKNPDVVLCSSDFSAFNEDRQIEVSHIATYYRSVSLALGGLKSLYTTIVEMRDYESSGDEKPITVYSGHIYEQLIWGNFVHPPTVMVRRSVVESAGGFDESISIATEYDWLIRVSRYGPAAYLDVPLLRYRYSGEQLSSPRHSAQISLDAVMTMEKIRRSDANLFRRFERRFQRRIGTCFLYAADASVEYDRIRATSRLLQSMFHGVFTISTIKVIIKLLLPGVVLRFLRQHRTVKGEPLAGHAPW